MSGLKSLRMVISITMAFIVLVFSGCSEKKAMLSGKNLALVAYPTSSMRWDESHTPSLNDGLIPDNTKGMTFNTNQQRRSFGRQWMQYDWNEPVKVNKVAIFWYNYDGNVKLPSSYTLSYWDGEKFVPVNNPVGLGLENDKFNTTTFDEISTTKLRVDADSTERRTQPALEWFVYKTSGSTEPAPVIEPGVERSVMTGGKTYLSGVVKSLSPLKKIEWKKASGAGDVTFADAGSLTTAATFSAPGEYVISLNIINNGKPFSSDLKVKVVDPPKYKRLDVVYTKPYKIDSPFWSKRAKAIIVNWIPWCISQIERTDLTLGQGGLDNFIEAGKALRGEPHGKHLGFVFSNAWVHQTIESMCIALMYDPQGDKEIIAAQEKMKKTIEKWIPIILSAQEPDGYLQTAYTLRDTSVWKNRWTPESRDNHEGYVSGYFIESAINHYTLTNGSDKRLYNAAKKLADCWVANIGPGKQKWYDGHQEMEQALVRFGRFVNDMEGAGKGDSYVALAKFLLDCREGGSKYNQSEVPVQQQYEAVGHAVRATYNYSAMADVAAETGDVDYQSAVMSLWDNMVNKKYYLTGGIGSGESSEGFGPNYSLRNEAYCESCSSCGLIFFQYKMNLAYNDAKYADLYEETMYNALLGSLDLEGKNFYYQNPLSSSQSRYSWHGCPCCVGNIPRTLLMIPTWSYVKSDNGLYVNMFIGSTIKIEKVAGTDVEMVQKTDYPWNGKVSMTVNPLESKEFTLFIRVPNRTTSELYKPEPQVSGIKSLMLNGKPVEPVIENGYAKISRVWEKGDKVDFELPLEIQTITADKRIEADRDRVALRYGPLVYNVETADQPDIDKYIGKGPLVLEWKNNLLGGVMTINGKWEDGTNLVAIPNYARNNRNAVHSTDRPVPGNKNEGSIVWIKKHPDSTL
jgi:uncharacterized protein